MYLRFVGSTVRYRGAFVNNSWFERQSGKTYNVSLRRLKDRIHGTLRASPVAYDLLACKLRAGACGAPLVIRRFAKAFRP